jgi:hypothetical protein
MRTYSRLSDSTAPFSDVFPAWWSVQGHKMGDFMSLRGFQRCINDTVLYVFWSKFSIKIRIARFRSNLSANSISTVKSIVVFGVHTLHL